MSRTVDFHPAAMEDAEAARDWYSERSSVAARAFTTQLIQAVQQIRESPESWPPYEFGTRRYVFSKFPFSVIYRVLADKKQIIAVAHAKRKPGYWTNRMP